MHRKTLNELQLLIVIPAKAEIQGATGRSGYSSTPAFVG
jgi:hypothetical protein